MKLSIIQIIKIIGACNLMMTGIAFSQSASIGIFEGNIDIGTSLKPGAVQYDSTQKAYIVTGGGGNMWLSKDAFHFVWKKVSGNVSLAADIRWIGTGGQPHRKACLILRQNLDPGSAYADAALHGEGLTSLQYREVQGELTHEIQTNVKSPIKARIEKEGDYVSMSIALENEPLQSAGGSFRIKFSEPFYIGLGVCSHDSSVVEKAVFSNIEIKNIESKVTGEPMLESTLETIAIASTDRKVIYRTHDHIEAPNWSRDGKYLLFNGNGLIYKLEFNNQIPQLIDTKFATHCNNDHGISPNGKLLAISDQSVDNKSLINILPIEGGKPRLITALGPSYWHGWSPDGKMLAYCAERNGQYDIYTIPITGGEEKQLTNAPGLDDGPDYSPDGQYIYFNSERTGLMQIWRMKTDGSGQEQVTLDDYNNWFPHPSPDGKWIVFLSYNKDVKGHPANKDVILRMMPVSGGEIKVLAKLFGGQGTINVPSWSPDSNNLAFVSYRLVNP
jgi:TolB protein